MRRRTLRVAAPVEGMNVREALQLRGEIEHLRALVLQGLAVVDDFLPNIGQCVLQDYGRLNEFCMEARRLLGKDRAKMTMICGEEIWYGKNLRRFVSMQRHDSQDYRLMLKLMKGRS